MGARATAHVCRSENNILELVIGFYHVGSGIKLKLPGNKGLCLLSYPASEF